MRPRNLTGLTFGFLLLAAGTARAQIPPLPVPAGSSSEDLVFTLRPYLVQMIPAVLIDERRDWGKQKLVTRGIEWKGKGKFGLRPSVQKAHKNHGVWRKVRVATGNLDSSLVLDLRNLQKPAADRMTFTVFLSFDARVDYDQQNWRSGIRTYAGSVRARLRPRLTMHCEVTTRLVKGKGLLPDMVFRARVLAADLGYDHFVVEHVAGVGGDMAKLLGSAAHACVNQWKPSIERNLIARANAAIVKAGDTKEIRLSLSKLFE
jgi:hypothetical protein